MISLLVANSLVSVKSAIAEEKHWSYGTELTKNASGWQLAQIYAQPLYKALNELYKRQKFGWARFLPWNWNAKLLTSNEEQIAKQFVLTKRIYRSWHGPRHYETLVVWALVKRGADLREEYLPKNYATVMFALLFKEDGTSYQEAGSMLRSPYEIELAFSKRDEDLTEWGGYSGYPRNVWGMVIQSKFEEGTWRMKDESPFDLGPWSDSGNVYFFIEEVNRLYDSPEYKTAIPIIDLAKFLLNLHQ